MSRDRRNGETGGEVLLRQGNVDGATGLSLAGAAAGGPPRKVGFGPREGEASRRSRWQHRHTGTNVPRSRASARWSDTGRPARRLKGRQAWVWQRTGFGPGEARRVQVEVAGLASRLEPTSRPCFGTDGEGERAGASPEGSNHVVTGVPRASAPRARGVGWSRCWDWRGLESRARGASASRARGEGPGRPCGMSGTDRRSPRALCPGEPKASPGAVERRPGKASPAASAADEKRAGKASGCGETGRCRSPASAGRRPCGGGVPRRKVSHDVMRPWRSNRKASGCGQRASARFAWQERVVWYGE
jgi:hypothetical protein